ncbi:ketopantoate reductase PanE/ApbA C terminal-domain-containing protein [Podospora didyma]|uniref:Ketopantoate reductase PanE/ApbA C terminal-domain-containing protein n=1 Tax=Podospora didyma TaxID=330526 RepID=A0AAE0P0J6_9PEZI|nr:ketopantoate reductase PanE/ApbA C terminal-domain-containing protein [Podospora didyma]
MRAPRCVSLRLSPRTFILSRGHNGVVIGTISTPTLTAHRCRALSSWGAPPDDAPRHESSPDDTIYILGVGRLGQLVAHALAQSKPQLPVALLFHRRERVDEFKAAGHAIECTTPPPHPTTDKQTGFRFENLQPPPLEDPFIKPWKTQRDRPLPAPPKVPRNLDPIKYLVVATKAVDLQHALGLGPIRDRLNHDSTILFLPHGMGITDLVSTHDFPDPKLRPTYWAAICSASVYSTAPFSIVHAKRGPLTVGRVMTPDDDAGRHAQENNHLIRQLLQAKALETTVVSADELKEAQLLNLVVEAVVSSLTAIHRCSDGELLDDPSRLTTITKLLEEVGPIVRALLPTSLDDRRRRKFSDAGLMDLVRAAASSTAKNTSPLLRELREGERPDIDAVCGYLVKQGRIHGLPTTLIRLVYKMICGEWFGNIPRGIPGLKPKLPM